MTVTLGNTPAAWSARANTACPLEAVGWTAAGQQSRFAKVLAELQPQKGERLLDYGCGLGALVDHLPDGVEYVGYDFAPGMVERARREHPGVIFLDREYGLYADVVACIGPFNLPDNWSKAGTWQTLRRLWDAGPRALAVSLYAGTDERCLVYDADETRRALGGLSWSVSVERWRPNDLLAVVRR